MENLRKPPTDREQICTREIQEAEKEIARKQFELDSVVDAAQAILDKLRDIRLQLQSGPTLQEEQKLREEGAILRGDQLYAKYVATYMQLRNAEHKRDSYMSSLRLLKVIEAFPATPLPETSALETAALLHGDKSAESGSPNSVVSDSTPVRGFDSWVRGLFNMKIKQD